jgi:hypothetical protein
MMKIIHSDDSIEKLTEAMPLWWADRHTGAPWTEAEQNEIFRGLVSAARSANIDQMRWLLDEWGIKLCPPRTIAWDWITIADNAVMAQGQRGHYQNWLDDEITLETRKPLERVKVYSYLLHYWPDGRTDTFLSSLTKFKGKMKEHQINSWICRLEQNGTESVIDIITFLMDRDPNGPFSIPRLDIVVVYGYAKVLLWLVKECKGICCLRLILCVVDLKAPLVLQEDDVDMTEAELVHYLKNNMFKATI